MTDNQTTVGKFSRAIRNFYARDVLVSLNKQYTMINGCHCIDVSSLDNKEIKAIFDLGYVEMKEDLPVQYMSLTETGMVWFFMGDL